jgi:hypothetical protein
MHLMFSMVQDWIGSMTGTLADHERLCTALDAFHEADRARDKAILALGDAAFAVDEHGARRAGSTVAFAEQRVKSFRASVQAPDELLTAVEDKRRWGK